MAGRINRQILLKSRPEGAPGLDNFELTASAGAGARRGRGAHAHALSLARSLHARPHERGEVLCDAGRGRAADGRRHGRGDRRVAPSGLSRSAISCVGRGGWQDYALSSGAGCASSIRRRRRLDRARRARHAGDDRLCRPARDRPAEAGRDRGGCGGLGRGRLGGRADRQDQRVPRGRDRRRRRQVPLRRRRARLRCLRRSSRAAISRSSSRPRVRTASTSISRMSAAPCSRRCGRCSTISPAFRCAG